MKIVILTGIYPPKIGGPAQYAKNLKENLEVFGHSIKVFTYNFEDKLPSGLRHVFFFIKIIFNVWKSDFIICLDTFSVALPGVLAAKILKKKIIIRTGGDFLWEAYVERTGKPVLFKNFYNTELNFLNKKEKIVLSLTKYILKNTTKIVFSTTWQREVWLDAYKIDANKTKIIKNYFGEKEKNIQNKIPDIKVFLGATRPLVWKNLSTLYQSFSELKDKNKDLSLDLENAPYNFFVDKIKNAYAIILVSLGDISPNLILDAIRYGVPFIATRECGFYEEMRGKVGVWVDPMSKDEIKKAVLDLSDPFTYAREKKQIENFSYTHTYQEIAKEFLEVYKNLCQIK